MSCYDRQDHTGTECKGTVVLDTAGKTRGIGRFTIFAIGKTGPLKAKLENLSSYFQGSTNLRSITGNQKEIKGNSRGTLHLQKLTQLLLCLLKSGLLLKQASTGHKTLCLLGIHCFSSRTNSQTQSMAQSSDWPFSPMSSSI